MFFNVFNRALVCAGIFALTACGGGEPVDSTTTSIPAGSSSAVQQAPFGIIHNEPALQNGAPARAAAPVSAAEREAEQVRMIAYEQSFAIEMRRRAQERPEHLRGQGEPVQAPAQPACDGAADPALPSGCAGSQPANPSANPSASLPANQPDNQPEAAVPVATPGQAL